MNLLKICINQLLDNLKNEKVHSFIINKSWGADLADMQLLRKFNKGIHFLLFRIDIYSKYAWVIPLKHMKGIIITNTWQKIVYEWVRKPNMGR